ncbi:MAG: ACT domain-containing protein [Ruminiclostridium sp.]|nr:ACT domain-containing protein [Ruminiclostridium sp.]
MEIEALPYELTVCKVRSFDEINTRAVLFFTGKTDEEISLVCTVGDVPVTALEREDGWKAFRIRGVLDFSLTGVLSRISGILAENNIGIFAVSTYNTDYILVKKDNFDKALEALGNNGYTILDQYINGGQV